MAKNKKREVKAVTDKVDELYNPLLDIQKQGRNERTQEDYPTSAVHFL